jgi:hypothetical protein
MNILKLIGYASAKEALSLGFTHSGDYYKIPCWIGDVDGEFMVMTKWAPLELVVSLFHIIEGIMNDLLGNEPSFKFNVGKEIS